MVGRIRKAFWIAGFPADNVVNYAGIKKRASVVLFHNGKRQECVRMVFELR